MHISSSYAKILGEKLFRTWEIPQSGSKAEDGGKREKERKRERLNNGENNGQATHGARKHAWRTQAAWAKNSGCWVPLKWVKSNELEFLMRLGPASSCAL